MAGIHQCAKCKVMNDCLRPFECEVTDDGHSLCCAIEDPTTYTNVLSAKRRDRVFWYQMKLSDAVKLIKWHENFLTAHEMHPGRTESDLMKATKKFLRTLHDGKPPRAI